MSLLVVLSTLALAGVFVAAGVAKLLDSRGSRDAARAFGIPDRFANAVARVLPFSEIAIAVLLLPAATRSWAALAALVLLVLFCAAIGGAMSRGETPNCHCFGQLHSAPAGWGALARNAVLAAMAAFVAVASRGNAPSVFSWMPSIDGTTWVVIALAGALVTTIAVGGYAVVHVMRGYGRLLTRLDRIDALLHEAGFELVEPDEIPELGLSPGTPAPAFSLPSIDGGLVSLGDLRSPGNPVLLLFTSPKCGPCSLLMPTIAEWQREHYGELTIALVSDGDADAIRAEAAEHELVNVLIDEGLSTYTAYEANGTPSAVLVGDDGNIASWLAAGRDWIESLVRQALGGLGRTPGLPIGSPLPTLPVTRLDGAELALAESIARETVVLFWNPSCGFCRSLHGDLRAWESAPPDGAPALVVVSAGDVVGVRAEGFASDVVLDPEWSVSGALGADGTPMAVLVSADGRIASSVVGGGPAVLELLGAAELAALH